MVEETVVLVVHDEQHGLRPRLGIGDEGVEHLLGEPHARRRGRGRVLVVAHGGDDPRHLGQGVVGHVPDEVSGEIRSEGLLVER